MIMMPKPLMTIPPKDFGYRVIGFRVWGSGFVIRGLGGIVIRGLGIMII